jgi:hypothetical protein
MWILLIMRRNFWKATLISIAAYTAAVLIGVLGDLRFTVFAVPALQITWTLFCVARFLQLRVGGAHKADAPVFDRESYGFALGGWMSSAVLLVAVVVVSQVITDVRR